MGVQKWVDKGWTSEGAKFMEDHWQKRYKIPGRPATIFRTVKSKEHPYVMIDRRIIDNVELSFKAKGILLYLLSRPDGWEICLADLVQRSSDGLASIKAGVKELVQAGHLHHTVERNEQGKITSHVWEVFEIPSDTPISGQPEVDNQLMDTPPVGCSDPPPPTDDQPEVEKPQDGFTTSWKSPTSSIKYLNIKEINNREEGEKQKNLDALRLAAPLIFGNYQDEWCRLEQHLMQEYVQIHHYPSSLSSTHPGRLVISCIGELAEMYQEWYARSFSHCLAGIFNEPTELLFQEKP